MKLFEGVRVGDKALEELEKGEYLIISSKDSPAAIMSELQKPT